MSKRLFSERVRDALASGSSAEASALIREAETTAAAAVERHAAARERSLDPCLSDDEIAEARRLAEDAQFERDRMLRAAEVLRDKLEAFRQAEAQDARRRVYDAALARRDAVSATLRAEYPELANRLGALLAEIVAADRDVERANADLPSGAERIDRVEVHARPDGALLVPRGGPWLTDMRILRLANDHIPVWGRGETMSTRMIEFRPDEGAVIGGAPEASPMPRSGEADAGEAGAGSVSPVSNAKGKAA